MRAPHWQAGDAALYVGDAAEVIAEMPDGSVDCVVTSPPYWRHRDYDDPGQYGQEATPEEYVAHLQGVFAQARRVLADDGTLWVGLGDAYSGAGTSAPKNLMGMPWRVAFALQGDGWLLRNAIVWHKPNAMPSPVRDRMTCRYELIFLLAKRNRYHFDLDPIRQRYEGDRSLSRRAHRTANRPTTAKGQWPPVQPGKYAESAGPCAGRDHGPAMRPTGRRHTAAHELGRNPGDVWDISTRPFRQAHFAVWPIDIPLRAIAAGCREDGTVLDPFSGAGTTGLAATQLGRTYIGIDINPEYCDLAAQRMAEHAERERPT